MKFLYALLIVLLASPAAAVCIDGAGLDCDSEIYELFTIAADGSVASGECLVFDGGAQAARTCTTAEPQLVGSLPIGYRYYPIGLSCTVIDGTLAGVGTENCNITGSWSTPADDDASANAYTGSLATGTGQELTNRGDTAAVSYRGQQALTGGTHIAGIVITDRVAGECTVFSSATCVLTFNRVPDGSL